MDVPRPKAVRNKRIKRAIYALIAVIALSFVALGVSRLQPAAPSVEKATVWMDTVKRGPMLRDVRGLGTLVPEELRWIPATRDGIVERINVKIGDVVKAETVLLILSNPELEQSLVDAELQIKAAEADVANTRAQLQSQVINQEIVMAAADAAAKRAKLQADVNQTLASQGLLGDLPLKLSQVDAENSAAQSEMEKKRVAVYAQAAEAQISAAESRIQQLRTAYELKKTQIEQLRVRAGAAGVLQQLPVEVGQRVNPGTILAKVAEPGRLKAELKIAETQAKDIAIGQIAQIDTRNGIVRGRVSRIDPAATQGTVTVDVQLEGDLPKGARPDLSVDGTVEIERLDSVVYVGRPAYGQADTTVGMFKIMPTGEAVRAQVKLGRASVNMIEIREGLQVGDQVILSDMSQWDAYNRVKLN
jgi:HlyD family secretion protein